MAERIEDIQIWRYKQNWQLGKQINRLSSTELSKTNGPLQIR